MTGWCADSAFSQSLPAFHELEKAFRVTKTEASRLDAIAAPLIFDMPYLSDDAARQLARVIKEMDPEDRHSGGYKALQMAVRRLPAGDRSEFNGILSRALSSLPRQDYTRLRADQAHMMREEKIDPEEVDWYQKVMTAM